MRHHKRHKNFTLLIEDMPVVEGRVLGERGTVLRDSGSNSATVLSFLVLDGRLTGKTSTMILVNGSVNTLQEAVIHIYMPYFNWEITAACMKKPIYGLVLSNILRVRAPRNQNLSRDDRFTISKKPGKMKASQQFSSKDNPVLVSAVAEEKTYLAALRVTVTGCFDASNCELAEEQRKDNNLKSCFRNMNRHFSSGNGNC
ncbi:hypothetical protein HPB48_023006 [Haemaphysalis longicornis]|uniref:Uncharacterized protein n=1 Tax=Haemaphysalis longicornis TaxID=44386 RepID=A0A9J6GLG7_HAELO|nr:hypothetical protein HPB48_023006 [Haemaphysalis longicornis]